MNQPPFFDTCAGLGVDAQPGPYSFEGDVRIYPLLSSEAHLQKFMDAYLNKRLAMTGAKFQVLGDHVFLVSTNFFTATGGDGVGISRARSLTFHIPVLYSDVGNKVVGVVQVFTFDRTVPGVITDREVRGVNASKARIAVPRNKIVPKQLSVEDRRELMRGSIFLEDLSPVGGTTDNQAKTFLTLSTLVSNFLGNDVAARDDVLLEMRNEGDQMPALPKQGRRRAAAPIADLLDGTADYNIFTLKQFPDAFDETRACYQGLMLLRNRFRRATLHPMPQDCMLRIYKYQSHPIVENLGLQAEDDLEPGRRAVEIRPVNPFLLRDVIRHEDKGECLYYRYDQTWHRQDVALGDSSSGFNPFRALSHYMKRAAPARGS